MAKILCGKTRKTETPWAIFKRDGWEWRILKNYQNDVNKNYARWFCAVKSPMTHGSWEMGDTYVSQVMGSRYLVAAHPDFIEHIGWEPSTVALAELEILGD